MKVLIIVVISFSQILPVKEKLNLLFDILILALLYTELYYFYSYRNVVDHIPGNLFYKHMQFFITARCSKWRT